MKTRKRSVFVSICVFAIAVCAISDWSGAHAHLHGARSRKLSAAGNGVLQPTPHPVPAAAPATKFSQPPASSDRLVVRPRQRQMEIQRQQQQQQNTHSRSETLTNATTSSLRTTKAERERAAFEAEARDRERSAIRQRMAYVTDAHSEAAVAAANYERSLARGENQFVADVPAWDYDMPLQDRIRAATEAPVIELQYCCCRCGGNNETRDDTDAVFEYAESTEYECEDDWCQERFALCRHQFVWNGRTGTMGLRDVQHPSPHVIENRCNDLWRRSLEMIAVLAVSD